jgi:hypothetical protein
MGFTILLRGEPTDVVSNDTRHSASMRSTVDVGHCFQKDTELRKSDIGGKTMRFTRPLLSAVNLILIGVLAVLLIQAAPAQ